MFDLLHLFYERVTKVRNMLATARYRSGGDGEAWDIIRWVYGTDPDVGEASGAAVKSHPYGDSEVVGRR